MENKSKRGTATNMVAARTDFGAMDRFGRKIGTIVTTFEIDFTEAAPEAISYYTMAPGHYYGLNVWATRNGLEYGAVQHDRYFNTEAERTAAIEKYLKEAAKRATKIH